MYDFDAALGQYIVYPRSYHTPVRPTQQPIEKKTLKY